MLQNFHKYFKKFKEDTKQFKRNIVLGKQNLQKFWEKMRKI